MVTFTIDEIKELCTPEEHEKLGVIMWDNCTVEQKQEVISMFLQERKGSLTTAST